MDLELIERLIDIVARSGMAEVEVEQDDFKVVVRAHQHAHSAPAPVMVSAPTAAAAPTVPVVSPVTEAVVPAAETSGMVVRAPIVGTLYRAPAPGADPFVKVGDRVDVGSVLCIIEAMKLMNEIQSDYSGTITQILINDGEPVEYDQPLFVVDEA